MIYIETPQPTGKFTQLMKLLPDAAEITASEFFSATIRPDEDTILICVVKNQNFDAVAVVPTAAERERISPSIVDDKRPRRYLVAMREDVIRLLHLQGWSDTGLRAHGVIA